MLQYGLLWLLKVTHADRIKHCLSQHSDDSTIVPM